MTDFRLGGLFHGPGPSQAPSFPLDGSWMDPQAPLGTERHPLGNPEHAAQSYLLGLRCRCGTTSLAFAASVESDEGVLCPTCLNLLG